jgi:hypothetical protein
MLGAYASGGVFAGGGTAALSLASASDADWVTAQDDRRGRHRRPKQKGLGPGLLRGKLRGEAALGLRFPRDVDTGLCRDLVQGSRCEGLFVISGAEVAQRGVAAGGGCRRRSTGTGSQRKAFRQVGTHVRSGVGGRVAGAVTSRGTARTGTPADHRPKTTARSGGAAASNPATTTDVGGHPPQLEGHDCAGWGAVLVAWESSPNRHADSGRPCPAGGVCAGIGQASDGWIWAAIMATCCPGLGRMRIRCGSSPAHSRCSVRCFSRSWPVRWPPTGSRFRWLRCWPSAVSWRYGSPSHGDFTAPRSWSADRGFGCAGCGERARSCGSRFEGSTAVPIGWFRSGSGCSSVTEPRFGRRFGDAALPSTAFATAARFSHLNATRSCSSISRAGRRAFLVNRSHWLHWPARQQRRQQPATHWLPVRRGC